MDAKHSSQDIKTVDQDDLKAVEEGFEKLGLNSQEDKDFRQKFKNEQYAMAKSLNDLKVSPDSSFNKLLVSLQVFSTDRMRIHDPAKCSRRLAKTPTAEGLSSIKTSYLKKKVKFNHSIQQIMQVAVPKALNEFIECCKYLDLYARYQTRLAGNTRITNENDENGATLRARKRREQDERKEASHKKAKTDSQAILDAEPPPMIADPCEMGVLAVPPVPAAPVIAVPAPALAPAVTLDALTQLLDRMDKRLDSVPALIHEAVNRRLDQQDTDMATE
jgi:hypothetical protein